MEEAAVPSRYAVQRSRGGKWDTLHLDEDQAAATGVFQQLVALKPRFYARLIVVESDAELAAGQDFRWRLLHLYDPFASGACQRDAANTAGRGNAGGGASGRQSAGSTARASSGRSPRAGRHRPGHERVRIPVRIYLWAIGLGLVAGAVAVLGWGNRL